jgi:microcystin-dependent protein
MDPFLGEIKIMSCNFPPDGWAECDGSLLPINTNMALFSLLGTTFGGNGQTTFALPDLRGRVPLHRGTLSLGQTGGEEAHALSVDELPTHKHTVQANGAIAPDAGGNQPLPTKRLAGSAAAQLYHAPASLQPMHPAAVSSVGGNEPHDNMAPSAVLMFCIALQGIFPSFG